MIKSLPTNTRHVGFISGSGRSPGEGISNPSNIFAWEVPWTEELDSLQSMQSQKSQTQVSD